MTGQLGHKPMRPQSIRPQTNSATHQFGHKCNIDENVEIFLANLIVTAVDNYHFSESILSTNIVAYTKA